MDSDAKGPPAICHHLGPIGQTPGGSRRGVIHHEVEQTALVVPAAKGTILPAPWNRDQAGGGERNGIYDASNDVDFGSPSRLLQIHPWVAEVRRRFSIKVAAYVK